MAAVAKNDSLQSLVEEGNGGVPLLSPINKETNKKKWKRKQKEEIKLSKEW